MLVYDHAELFSMIRSACREECRAAVEQALKHSAQPAGRQYTPKKAAELLSCTAGHVRDLISTGELPAIRKGRRFLIPESSIRDYLAAPGQTAIVHPGRAADELLARRVKK